ncbi:Senescence regulator [Quillaja saponaria]|uniref:Senescence regulator n=1 Tax=Quillaja saponaria TaxID=32244 RepID=A0AAD7M504_QUISA|nr:Senescence regulator [Quillaja saponaria]
MAEEEFQESDVIFSDHDHRNFEDSCFDYRNIIMPVQHNMSKSFRNSSNTKSKNKSKSKKKKMASSVPVNIPERIYRDVDSDDQFEDEWDDEEMVPPHVIVGRRIAGKMAFSVCTGNGRTLKGRDLSQVRNSILRMTGFLET